MLILTRKISESINIGDDVTVSVLGIKGSQVRLGITAPKNISVHREEIYNRIQQEKQDYKQQQFEREDQDNQYLDNASTREPKACCS